MLQYDGLPEGFRGIHQEHICAEVKVMVSPKIAAPNELPDPLHMGVVILGNVFLMASAVECFLWRELGLMQTTPGRPCTHMSIHPCITADMSVTHLAVIWKAWDWLVFTMLFIESIKNRVLLMNHNCPREKRCTSLCCLEHRSHYPQSSR